MSQQQLSLELPYEIIDKVANRPYLRETYSKGPTESYWIPFEEISSREGFNRFMLGDIEELALLMEKHGQLTPFRVDVLPDGKVKIDEGERRYRAMQLNRAKGSTKFDFVLCFVNNSSVTEEDRADRIWTSNQGRFALHPIDQAQVVYRKKYLFSEKPLANETIAEAYGISRQTVDNLLLVWAMPDDVKNDIRNDVISVTKAIEQVRDQKKHQKQADKAEEQSHITSDAPIAFPKDELADEVAELKALEIQAEATKQREAEFERKELERLEKDAVLVPVTVEALTPHIGKRLAANAMYEWFEDFTDERTGEVVPVQSSMIVIKQGVPISEQVIEDLKAGMVAEVWVLKEITASPSVITELPGEKEKPLFDEGRAEIASINNAIKLGDKIATQIEKLDLPEGLKKDIASWSQWQMTSMLEAREYIHKNKKENKIR